MTRPSFVGPTPSELRQAYERALDACTAAWEAGVLPSDIVHAMQMHIATLRRVPGQPFYQPPSFEAGELTPDHHERRVLFAALHTQRRRAERALALRTK